MWSNELTAVYTTPTLSHSLYYHTCAAAAKLKPLFAPPLNLEGAISQDVSLAAFSGKVNKTSIILITYSSPSPPTLLSDNSFKKIWMLIAQRVAVHPNLHVMLVLCKH